MPDKTCATCGTKLQGSYAITRDDRLLCLECYDKETTVEKKSKKKEDKNGQT